MLRGEWNPRIDEDASMSRSPEVEATRPVEALNGGDMIRIQEETPKEQSGKADEKMEAFDSGMTTGGDYQMEDLEVSLRSLALVPDRIRFGRGSKHRGFARGGRGMRRSDNTGSRPAKNGAVDEENNQNRGQAGRNRIDAASRRMDIGDLPEANFVIVNTRGRGRGRIYLPSG
jgi:hypothetical protein